MLQGSGHIAIAGPDLAGTPHANVVTFAPPVVESADRTFNIGRVSRWPMACSLSSNWGQGKSAPSSPFHSRGAAL
jgi:hypothetical protein